MPLFDVKVSPQISASAFRPSQATVTFLLFAAAFLFTWYALRPSFFAELCGDRAGGEATKLLEMKAQLTNDPAEARQFTRTAAVGLYLQGDYDFLYRKCLEGHGVVIE